ncbi:MAG: hypothetical protein LHW45_11165, partial [Candidatus Cloacimonetes bacterium]|nr:hypothetical protein [Candidatus Cloacimonadota bacterium]MDY0368167.1 hypothetical protein [Candidatus Syntrophosphaera sp.]
FQGGVRPRPKANICSASMAILLREGYPNWARSVNSTLNVEEPSFSEFQRGCGFVLGRENGGYLLK